MWYERSIWSRSCGFSLADSYLHEGLWLDLVHPRGVEPLTLAMRQALPLSYGCICMIYEPCVILKPEMVQIAKTARVDGFVKIEGGLGVTIGEFVHVASFSHLNVGGGQLVMEDHSGCSSHCCIGSGSPDWSYLYISAAEPPEHHHTNRTLTRICAYAVLFMGVVVVPGVTVGEGAIALPGSVVYEDVPPWYIVKGNPAVKVGYRKIDDERHGSFSLPKRHRIPGAILRANG